MEDLTKDQQYLLGLMYKHFLSLQPALNPTEANYFEDTDSLIPLLNLDFSPDYVAEMCLALLQKEYICGYCDEDSVSEFCISDKTIVYMENRCKNNLKELFSFLASLK